KKKKRKKEKRNAQYSNIQIVMFNSMYKYSCLSIYAEAWLWDWGKCLPNEKVSVKFQVSLSHGTQKQRRNMKIQVCGFGVCLLSCPTAVFQSPECNNFQHSCLVYFSCNFLLMNY
uniref:Uncharacterized protein n=1 Tax=Sciurus vulgaris TaxID=55149 RepID=A0A8D2CKM2_SCIVU